MINDDHIQEALTILKEEGWRPSWQFGYYIEWSLHDVLCQVTGGLSDGFAVYTQILERFTRAVGEDVLDWERQPGRRQEDVEAMFGRVLSGE